MIRTQVAIVGAGPAGLVLGHLLQGRGIDSVVLEARSRQYVEQRVRAGVLEYPTVQLLCDTGVGDRLQREGLRHRGIRLRFDREDHLLDFVALTGRSITVYGQQEVVKDLIGARLAADGPILFEVGNVRLSGLDTDEPEVSFTGGDGVERVVRAAVVAGCDGFHGVSRPSIPDGHRRVFEREYPFAWLGILAEAAPVQAEVTYAYSDRGFALASMRSPEISRLYLQVVPDETLDAWPDDRIWEELNARLALDQGFALNEGPVFERAITPMRSFVVEPMRYGRLFLAGDAAHIVPPTGAKGMNLAVADVAVLAEGLERFFTTGATDLLNGYSERCLRRVWRAEHFSWWMTSMLHLTPGADAFERRLQLSQLRYVTSSEAAAISLAENYAGLPYGA
ncbi:MAG TPA: 4-hydroxybenzoate 3-monooxygenase [Acidimicrobiia bacterium]|nr:4-hydroxybenzoate 3-monooxygenase [Acidimicrobiia bacterium]